MYAPTTVTRAESFLWYAATPRLQLGPAYLWKQEAFRFLGSYQLSPETGRMPSLSASVGVQGIGTGNPGYSITAEKNWLNGEHRLNAFVGAGFRSNEEHLHPVVGARWTHADRLTLGIQWDGHQSHPFVTATDGRHIGGVYLVDWKSPALMFGLRY